MASKTSALSYPIQSSVRLTTAFPWLLFLCTWLFIFVLENRMDAPATTLEDLSLADVTQVAAEGDIIRKVLVVLFAVLGGMMLYKYRSRLRIDYFVAGLFVLYMAWIGIGATVADDPALTFRRMSAYFLTLVFCAGCAARMDMPSLSIFFAAIPALNILPGIVAEMRYKGLGAFAASNRFGGTAPHPNVEAASLAMPAIVLPWLFFQTRGLTRVGVLCANLVVDAFLIMTGSRTSIIAVFLSIVFSLVLYLVRNEKRHLIGILAALFVLVAVMGLFWLVADSRSDRVDFMGAARTERNSGDPATLSGRTSLWKTCLGFAYERPIFGFGFGGFWSAKHIEYISEEEQWIMNQSHSAYLDQVLALGFPGAAFHILILFSCLGICVFRFSHGEDWYGAWAAIFVFLAVHGLTEAISVAPVFPNLVLNLMAVYIALRSPRDSDVKIPAYRAPSAMRSSASLRHAD